MNKAAKQVSLLIEGEYFPTMATATDQLCEENIREALNSIMKISKIDVVATAQSKAHCNQYL